MNSLTWQANPPRSIESALQTLIQKPSLTLALTQLHPAFSVQLDYLGKAQTNAFFQDLRLPETVFTRNVHLLLDNIAVVSAQSVCLPESKWCAILNCGRTSLGSILFSGSLNIQRSDLSFCHTNNTLTRRSWFEYEGERLYLVECFLPELMPFLNNIQAA